MAHISIEEARQAVLAGVESLGAETIPLPLAAGRVLAAAVLADRDQPPFDRAMMDGFAVRAQDVAEVPVTLPVAGEVAAGQSADRPLGAGEAIRIMTGAPVPPGADAVQMIENTDGGRSGSVRVDHALPPGRHIATRGGDIRAGEVAVPAGTRLTSSRLSLCWMMGASRVSVYRRPRVVILSTGDELVELGQTPAPHQIRDSNRASIGDLAKRAGADVLRSALVRDDLDATRRAIAEALQDADVLLLSGGVSAGDYDFVGDALEAEGVERIFHKVHMKPGKPLWYGRRGAQTVFGLPGNPVSSFLCTRMFVQPQLRRLGGSSRVWDPVLRLPLLEAARGTGARPTFQPATVEWGLGVRIVGFGGSGDLRGFTGGTAVALLPANQPSFDAGTLLDVYIDEESLRG